MHCLWSTAALFVSLSLSLTSLAAEPQQGSTGTPAQRRSLWNGNAPIGGGKSEDGDAWITVHRPAKSNGTAIVICPGGGYGVLVTGAEGHGIARWLNGHGIIGVVLEYRLPKGRSMVPLLDAQQAIRTVRANAKEWSIEPTRIGIMRFSAGGHLASTAGTHFDAGDRDADTAIARASCRPDFMVLVYPVITMDATTHRGCKNNLLGCDASAELVTLFSNEKQVTPRTPPAFLAQPKDDKAVSCENSKAFHEALVRHKVPSRYLELPSGGHGLNGYRGPMWDAWQTQSLAWLGELKTSLASNVQAEVGVGAKPIPGEEVVFDGSRAMLDAKWQYWEGPRFISSPPIKWKIVDDPVDKGTVLMTDDPAAAGGKYGTADVVTKKKYRDFRLHIEFLVTKKGGNSGVYLKNRYEIQVLDGDKTKHGMGAVINETPSPYHAYRGVGKWNAYDITFRSARFENGKRTEKAMVSMFFNGIKVHSNQTITQVWGGKFSGIDGGNDDGKGITDVPGGLKLQCEGHDVRYRNIWIKELDLANAETD